MKTSALIKQVALLSVIGLLGCSSAVESGPVSLPTPFSGALTNDSVAVVSNGLPVEQGILFGHPSGKTWELFEEGKSNSIGVVIFNLETATPMIPDGLSQAFRMDVSLQFDNGARIDARQMQFFDFPSEADPKFSLSQAAPGESGASIRMIAGSASGLVNFASDLFPTAMNQNLEHKYVYGDVVHGDGKSTFFEHQLCTWRIPGFQGFEDIGGF